MATRAQIRRQIIQLREQIRELRAAGRNEEAKALRAQINALLEQRDAADAEPTGIVQDYERRWAAMLNSYFDAMRSGNEAAAQAAVREYRALRDEIYAAWREAIAADRERYQAALDPAVFAANQAAGVGTPHPFDEGWTPDPNIEILQTMFRNASAFLLTMAGASQAGNWQAEPGQVIDTDAEKLLGWGATQEQADAWDRYQDLIDSGVGEAEALAQSGLTAQQVAEYSTITAWSPDEWAQNYHDILSGNRTDELPARYGPEQLSGNLYTVDEQGNPITPTYGGAGLGSVPGTMGTWSSIYGDAGGEAAWQRLSSDAYTLMGGWTSGYRATRGTGTGRDGAKPGPGTRTVPAGGGQLADLGAVDPFNPAAAGQPVRDPFAYDAGTPGEPLSQPVDATFPLGQPGPVTPTMDARAASPTGPAVIPAGGQLILRRGADAASGGIWWVVYDVFGVPVAYEIGNEARARELLGRDFRSRFDTVQTMSHAQFNALGALERGLIDEQIGNSESLQHQIQRGIKDASFEDMPGWMRSDKQVMTIVVTGTLEGWSSGRIWRELVDTEGFRTRFPAFDEVRSAHRLETIEDTVELYLSEEAAIREALRHYRGGRTDLSSEYIGSLMQTRWSSAEIEEVLSVERLLTADPDILVNLNQILGASGLRRLHSADLVDVIRGQAPQEVYEAINDTLRAQALREQGVEISPELAAELGEGVAERVASAEQRQQYSVAARQAALDLIQNWREVDLGKLGITRDQVVEAAFGEGFAAQTEATLQKFLRERQAAGQGWSGAAAYQGSRGEIVLAGLKQL